MMPWGLWIHLVTSLLPHCSFFFFNSESRRVLFGLFLNSVKTQSLKLDLKRNVIWIRFFFVCFFNEISMKARHVLVVSKQLGREKSRFSCLHFYMYSKAPFYTAKDKQESGRETLCTKRSNIIRMERAGGSVKESRAPGSPSCRPRDTVLPHCKSVMF